MDTKAMTISLALVTLTIIFVLAENEVIIAITSTIIFALMVKGFMDMYKEVKAIMDAEKKGGF